MPTTDKLIFPYVKFEQGFRRRKPIKKEANRISEKKTEYQIRGKKEKRCF